MCGVDLAGHVGKLRRVIGPLYPMVSDLMGGVLYRSMGGWRAVADLRRGSEAYRSDERVSGSSAFVESLLKEVDAQSKGRYRQVELSKLKKRIARDMGVSSHALAGVGRSENVSRARAVLCYVWMHYLGQSGRVLAEELGVSPQAVYAASSRVELEDWTRKSWKDGAGKIYCINWQRKGGKGDGKGNVRAECA